MSKHNIHDLKEKLDRLRAMQFYFLSDLQAEWDGEIHMGQVMRTPMLAALNELSDEVVTYCAALAGTEDENP